MKCGGSAGIFPHMAKTTAETVLSRIDRRIAALAEAGEHLTDRALSLAATGSPDTVRSIRRQVREGKQRGISSNTIEALAVPLRTSAGWLLNESGPETVDQTGPTVIRPEGPEPSEVRPAENAPRLSEFGDFDVEVRGISVGGEDDEFYFNGQVLEHKRRPPGLLRKKQVFAVHVSGDSMYPRYDPGDLIYAQEAEPVAGDDVLVELFHPDDENQAGKSFVKTLVRRTGRRVTCKQFNPPKEIEFDAGEVKAIYKVFRNRDLFG
jgi:phage repressor protein C with HTH and peptisase S24 domain